MKNLTQTLLKTWKRYAFLGLVFMTYQSGFSQTIMFDDFTYTGTTDFVNRSNASNKWNIIDGVSGPPDGAQYSKNNIEFVTDPDNASNKLMRVSTTVNGQTRAVVDSRVETDGFEYFEGTYAARVYLTDEATATQDGNNQTYFTIVSSDLASDGSKYSEMDIVEYLASDKWGLNPNKPALYTTSYNKYIADPWKAWKTYVVQKQSYGGWHIFMAVCTDKVNIRYYIDGVLISTQSVTDSESQAGLPVYPRSPMQIAFANWIVDNDLGPSTANRTNTMQVDWTLHYKNTALSYSDVNALVSSYRASGVQRRNLAGQVYSTGNVNQAPQVQLTSPANNATFSAPASITLSANATDADGTISKVEFFNGTASLGTDATAPYSIAWNNVAAGTYTLTAKATDNSNALTTSSSVTVVVNPTTTGPVVAYQNCNNDPGYSIGLPIGSYTTAQLIALGIKDNDISRLTVQSGYQVVLYDGDNFTGNSYTSTADASCLTSVSFNDLTSSIKVSLVNTNTQAPYGGTPANIPGVIEAENYDTGGQDVAYNDATPANEGGAYRNDAVDVEPYGTGYDVGYIINGEWLEYTVNVKAGTYKIDANVAAISAGKTFTLQLDGATIASFTVPNTGAWGTFQLSTVNNVVLTAGQKILRISATSSDFNVDKITFSVTNTTTNQAPTVTLTSPATNTSFSAPALLNISATANDVDGSIAKVEFYNGNTLIGSSTSAPYAYNWSNVAAGSYVITAKATDNTGAVTTSAAALVTVTPVVISNTCSGVAAYAENNGYVAGSIVQNSNSKYQCKPYPYSGWCNGAAWAYAPGTGAYWTDAWTLVSNCNNNNARQSEVATTNDMLLTNSPNPFSSSTTLQLQIIEAGEVTIMLYNKTGQVIKEITSDYFNAGTHQIVFNASDLKTDVYLIKCTTSTGVLTRKIIKTE